MASLKKITPLAALLLSLTTLHSQRIIEGTKAHSIINGSSMIRYVDSRTAPDYVRLSSNVHLSTTQAPSWLQQTLGMKENETLELSRVENDQIGMIHYTYQHFYQGVKVENSQYKTHTKNDDVISVNGEFYQDLDVNITPSITQQAAIQSAKAFVGAQQYRWEVAGDEQMLKLTTNNPQATYAPAPELVIAPVHGDYKTPEFRLCWKMDIYASQPLSRQWIYVDAHTGEVIWTLDRICHADAPGTANTAFSATRNIVADSFAGGFRLREASRGNGVETYNLNNATTYGGAVDFTDADNNWTTPSPAIDRYAYDAHWGAEMTYDYYMGVHSRNSIDNNGLKLYSYVHYDNGYGNAFWDGQQMTYGDGDGGTFNEPLTTIDITGHEISHGLTEYTAGLNYQDESGALNESFSDIFGVSIDFHARGTSGLALWRMGEECTVSANGIRRMDNPGLFGDPDTYNAGTWYTGAADNGGVHTNSGVQNFWYYLMCQGGTGTNDLSNAYSVTAIGMADAERIAFRNLTVYLGANSQYADSRFYAILSAQDLFGGCSPQVITTTNAWYAVGVGGPFVANVAADFSASTTSICNAPATINFQNLSNNGVNYTWYFGDGGTSTTNSPSHTYANNGTYNVALAVDGGTCGTDSIMYSSLITVNIPASPGANDTNICSAASVTLTASGSGTMMWFSSPSATTPLFTGNPYVTPVVGGNTTYYVAEQTSNGGGHVGPVDNTFGTGGNHNNTSTQYLEFTVYQPVTLNTVKVFSGGTGNRSIQLFDGNGNVLNTVTVNIPTGTSTVTLNLPLQPGNYRLGGTQMNLYRNNASASYPYTLAGLVDITGSSAGGAFYYYFYDWVVSSYCTSARTPVSVNVGGLNAAFTTNQTGSNVSFTNTSTNANSYYWDFGNGNTSTQTNPTFNFGGVGTFPVMLVAINGACSDTTYTNIVVSDAGIETPSIISSVYPNPFSGQVQFVLTVPADVKDMNIELLNALGQKVQHIYTGTAVSGSFTYTWNAPSELSAGMYLVRISYDGKQSITRIIKN